MSMREKLRALRDAAESVVGRSGTGSGVNGRSSVSYTLEALESRQYLSRAVGIDVSHYQGTINWTSVHNSGKQFAYVKSTEGVGVTDADFTTNMSNAKAAGMLLGVYHHATPATTANDATNEANYFVQVAGQYLTAGYLRPAVDISQGSSIGKTAMSTWVNTFISRVQTLTGVEPIIYANNDYVTNYFDSSVTNHTLWISRWSNAYGNPLTTGSPPLGAWSTANKTWDVWQYSNTGTVSGISGAVDLNVLSGDLNQLQNLLIGPAYAVSGNATVNGGAFYSLHLYPTNLGAHTQTSWSVNWGDGSAATTVNINPSDALNSYFASHIYANAAATLNVSATAVDDLGTHAAADKVAVTVNYKTPATVPSNYSYMYTVKVPVADTFSGESYFRSSVDAQGITHNYVSLTGLTAGQTYYMRASGWGNIEANTHRVLADAEYRFDTDTGATYDRNPTDDNYGLDLGVSLHEINTGSDGDKGGAWGSYNDQHYYLQTFTPSGTAESLKFFDSAYPNNKPYDSSPTSESYIFIEVYAAMIAPMLSAFGNQPAHTIDLQWNDVAGEHGFRVYRGTSATDLQPFGPDLAAGQLTLTDTTAVAGVSYYYSVAALDASGQPAPRSATVNAMLVQQALTLTASANNLAQQITIHWNEVGNENGFNIYRGPSPLELTLLHSVAAGVLTYADSAISNGTTYFYAVSPAALDGTDSSRSNVVAATAYLANPATPSNLMIESILPGAIHLSWTAGSNDETGFVLERKANIDGDWSVIATPGTSDGSYVDQTVSEGTQFYYRLQAVNQVGESDLTSLAAPITPLNAPTEFTATSVSLTQINLSWNENSNDERGYVIEQSVDNSTWTTIATTAANVTSYHVTPLTPDTQYYFRIHAENDVAVSLSKTTSTSTGTPALQAPSNLHVTAVASNQVSLTWTDDSEDEIGFTVQRSTDHQTWTNLAPNADSNATAYVDPEVAAGKLYFYRAFAFDNDGLSLDSNEVAVVTPLAGGTFAGQTYVTGIDFTATAGKPFIGAVAQFAAATFNSANASYAATIDWGDGTQSSGTIGASGGNSYYVIGSHTYASPDVAPLVITINDGTSEPATALATATINDAAPTITTAATARLSIDGTSVTLSVLGADAASENDLTYKWSVVGEVPGDITFDENATHNAQATTAYLCRAGVYHFKVSVTNSSGLSAESSVDCTVAQTLESLRITCPQTSVALNDNVQFTVVAVDQFQVPLETQPQVTWSAVSNGAIGQDGVFHSVGTNVQGIATVRAYVTHDQNIFATSSVKVVPITDHFSSKVQTDASGTQYLVVSFPEYQNNELPQDNSYFFAVKNSELDHYVIETPIWTMDDDGRVHGQMSFNGWKGNLTVKLYHLIGDSINLIGTASAVLSSGLTPDNPPLSDAPIAVLARATISEHDGVRDIQFVYWTTTSATNVRLQESDDGGHSFSNIANLPVNEYAFGTYLLHNAQGSVQSPRYRIVRDGAEDGDQSGTLPACPATPTNLVAVTSPADGTVQLSWNDAGWIGDGFVVERSTDGTKFYDIGSVSIGTRAYEDLAPVYGREYYRLVAYRTYFKNEPAGPIAKDSNRVDSDPSNTVSVHVDGPAIAVDDSTGEENPAGSFERYYTPVGVELYIDSMNGVRANDTDYLGRTIDERIVSGPAHAADPDSFALYNDGSFKYSPAPGFSGVDSFTYRADNGVGLSEPATVTIRVANRPVVTAPDAFSVANGGTVNIPFVSLAANDQNPDNAQLSYNLLGDTAHGLLTQTASGVTYTANPGYSGFEYFEYTVTGGGVTSNPSTVTLNVGNAQPQSFDPATFDNSLRGLQNSYAAALARKTAVAAALVDYGQAMNIVKDLPDTTTHEATAKVDYALAKLQILNTQYDHYVTQFAATQAAAAAYLQTWSGSAALYWERDDLYKVIADIDKLPSTIGTLPASKAQAQKLAVAARQLGDGTGVLVKNASTVLSLVTTVHDDLEKTIFVLGSASLVGGALFGAADIYLEQGLTALAKEGATQVARYIAAGTAVSVIGSQAEDLARLCGATPDQIRIGSDAVQLGFFLLALRAQQKARGPNPPKNDTPDQRSYKSIKVTSPNHVEENDVGRILNNNAGTHPALADIDSVEGWDQRMRGQTGGSEPDYLIKYKDGTEGYGDLWSPKNDAGFNNQMYDTVFDKAGPQTNGGIVVVNIRNLSMSNEEAITALDKWIINDQSSYIQPKRILIVRDSVIVGSLPK